MNHLLKLIIAFTAASLLSIFLFTESKGHDIQIHWYTIPLFTFILFLFLITILKKKGSRLHYYLAGILFAAYFLYTTIQLMKNPNTMFLINFTVIIFITLNIIRIIKSKEQTNKQE